MRVDDDENESMADQIVNGDFCEGCGTWMGEGDGFPRRCNFCSKGG